MQDQTNLGEKSIATEPGTTMPAEKPADASPPTVSPSADNPPEARPPAAETQPPAAKPAEPAANREPMAEVWATLTTLTAQCEELEFAQDQQELEAALVEAKFWAELRGTVRRGIQQTISATEAILSTSQKTEAALPAELRDRLKGRREGLELVGRMIGRLLDRIPDDDAAVPPPALPKRGLQAWATLLTEAKNLEGALKVLLAQWRQSGAER